MIPAPELGWALSRTLRAPLDGLRISMEALIENFAQPSFDAEAGTRTLEAAIEQVGRIARDVDALIAYARPRELAPLRCTLDELVHSTLSALPAALRARVRVNCRKPGKGLFVDGPLLASCLAHVIESSLEVSQEHEWLLLEVRRTDNGDGTGQRTAFRIFNGGAGSILGPTTDREDTPQGAHLGLGESLARRDLERMGSRLKLETDGEIQHLVVEVPDQVECLK